MLEIELFPCVERVKSWCPAIVALLAFTSSLTAQVPLAQSKSAQSPSETGPPNLRHERHLHRHNHRHATESPSAKRFFTTRSSEVVLPLPNEEDAFVFAVFGDRTGGPADGVNILADAVRDVNLIEPDLVMTVGDLINGYNRTDEWLEQMREFKSIMNELLCPWFPVAGNHDVYWRPLDDPQRPKTQHDEHYEMHFGPLWYSFQHKKCNFIVIYSDEGDPETGEKDFSKPQLQKIGDAQFAFLKEALERGKGDMHQFLFLHHPRWLGGGYGNDWKDRVHPLLKQAGNVTAVFAGHIHHMRYDPLDGIEYVTLATVGGGNSETVPQAGFLHQYHLVTVRPKQVAMVAYPVGEAMNVREITGTLQEEAVALSRLRPGIAGAIEVTDQGPQPTEFEVTVSNPATRPIDFTLTPMSKDHRWTVVPDHDHGTIPPGESRTLKFRAKYRSRGIDDGFDGLELVYSQDYLAPTTRIAIPDIRTPIPTRLTLAPGQGPFANQSLLLDGDGDAVEVLSENLALPQGPFTVECWFNEKKRGTRTGLLAKTEVSEFSIFLGDGHINGSVFLDGRYREVRPDQAIRTETWYHTALVYDGQAVALYLDGKSLGRTPVDPGWKRKANGLPFFIGADPGVDGKPTSFFQGEIDEVRVSSAAVYTEDFEPARRLTSRPDTVVLYNFDYQAGPIVFDAGPRAAHARSLGDARLTPAN